MKLPGDGIETDQLPRKMKTRDLLGAICPQRDAFHRTRADGENGFQGIALDEQRFAASLGGKALYQILKQTQIRLIDSIRQAQLSQAAISARTFQFPELHDFGHWRFPVDVRC